MDKVKIPVGMSAGGDNSYYVDCDHVQHKKAYCACLHIIARHKEGMLGEDQHTDCQNAILKGGCESQRMRAQEMKAGEALYYHPRQKVDIPVTKIDKSSFGYARGWNAVGGKLDNLPTPDSAKTHASKPSVKKVPQFSANTDYGKVVDNLLRKESKASDSSSQNVAKTNKSSVTEPKTRSVIGGSLLDIAMKVGGV